MNRNRFWLGAALLLLVILAIAFLLGDSIGARPRAVTLADGRTATIRGISSGTVHRFVYGNFWQRLSVLVLPARWAEKLGAISYRDITGQPAHVVWVELAGNALPGISRIWLADEDGTFIPAHALRADPTAGRKIQPYLFFAMPTGSRKVEVMIDMGQPPSTLQSLAERRKLGGSVRFKNPSYLSSPTWRGARPPVVIEQDELTIHFDYFGPAREEDPKEMADMNNRPGQASRESLSPVERLSRTELSFHIEDRSNPTNQWILHHLNLANEAGSEWVPGSQVTPTHTTSTSLLFTGRLSTNDLWKLRLFFLRRPNNSVDRLSKKLAPWERTIELIAQPGG